LERTVQVTKEVDVLVCGGGSAGATAAIAAARKGVGTLVVESGFALGGTATSGLLGRLGPLHDQEKFILGGLPWEILQELLRMDGARQPKPAPRSDKIHYWLPYSPEVLKVVLDRLAMDAGAEVLYDARIVEPLIENGSVTGALIATKNGLEAVRAKVTIDATGDADVAKAAGVPVRVGRDADGYTQPVSLAYYLHGINHAEAMKYRSENAASIKQMYKEELEAGANPRPSRHLSDDNYMHPDAVHFNVDHVFQVDASDPWVRTKSMMDARSQVWGNLDFLRRHIPACRNAYLGATGSLLGVRETRRILGEYELTLDDVVNARDFSDGIARYHCYVDIHPVESEVGHGKNYGLEPPAGASYGVPYRSLLPKNANNLLVAGRCLSATHEAMASVRMIPACMAMGEAAGTAASLCTEEDCTPHDIDPGNLRSVLEKQGVVL
jgi:hypothetical protein